MKIILIAAALSFSQWTWAQAELADQPAKSKEQTEGTLNKVVVGYDYNQLNQDFSHWRSGFISLGHRFSFGSVVVRYNRANRFDTIGEQIEIDSYPHIREGTYAYLNYGRSNSSIYPHDRFGGEIWQSLPASYEASLGFRKLEFKNSEVSLWTGSLAKYVGSYYLFVRPYYTPSSLGASSSWTLGGRYYLDDEQYFAAQLGWGLSVQQDSLFETVGLESSKAGVSGHFVLGDNWFIDPGVGFNKEEIRADVHRNNWSFNASVEKRF